MRGMRHVRVTLEMRSEMKWIRIEIFHLQKYVFIR